MHHNTKYRRLEKRHYNIVWLVASVLDRLAGQRKFVQEPHPNLARSESLDPPPSKRRLRFFLAHKGEQLIQFRRFGFVWNRSRGQFGGVGFDPVDHTLRIDLQDPSNTVITVAFHIHANGK